MPNTVVALSLETKGAGHVLIRMPALGLHADDVPVPAIADVRQETALIAPCSEAATNLAAGD
jgi:hypothetical protein